MAVPDHNLDLQSCLQHGVGGVLILAVCTHRAHCGIPAEFLAQQLPKPAVLRAQYSIWMHESDVWNCRSNRCCIEHHAPLHMAGVCKLVSQCVYMLLAVMNECSRLYSPQQASLMCVSECSLTGLSCLKQSQGMLEIWLSCMLQNALKIFKHMPATLMDIVKGTDPTTVTQHGLYMRPLTDPSTKPWAAPMSPSDLPKPPASNADMPLKTEEATSDQSSLVEHGSSPAAPGKFVRSGDAEKTAEKEVGKEAGGSVAVLTADNALAESADALSLEAPAAAASLQQGRSNGSIHLKDSSPLSALPNGSSTVTMGTRSIPMGKPSATKGKPEGKPAAPTGSSSASKGIMEDKAGAAQLLGTETAPSQLWGRGRVTLLGDAAHATIPNGTCHDQSSALCKCIACWSSPHAKVKCCQMLLLLQRNV